MTTFTNNNIPGREEQYLVHMTRYQYLSLTLLISLLLLAGICSAAESFDYLAILSGGESTIVNNSYDLMTITIHNPDPYLNVTNNTSNPQSPVDSLINASFPMNAIAIFTGSDTDSTSIIKIENLFISDDKTSLILQVRPLDYYDGEVLAPYALSTVNLHQLDNMTFNQTRLYLEMLITPPENFFPPDDPFPPKSPYERCLLLCLPIVCDGSPSNCNLESQCQAQCNVFSR